MRALVFLLVACGSAPPPAPQKETPVVPTTPVPAARPGSTSFHCDCHAYCDGVIRSRDDACGRNGGPDWPAWCGNDNERMRDHCLAACEE